MLWTLLSIVVAFAELIAFMSADWLIGKAKTRGGPGGGPDPEERGGPPEPHHPTLGIYARCIRNPGVQHVPRETLCGPYAENFGEIASGFWQATAIFLAMGILILCLVALVSVFTMCVQSIMKKSIFNVCGLLQGIAGKCARREGAWEREGGSAHTLAFSLTAGLEDALPSGQVDFAKVFSQHSGRAALVAPFPVLLPSLGEVSVPLLACSCSLLFPRVLSCWILLKKLRRLLLFPLN